MPIGFDDQRIISEYEGYGTYFRSEDRSTVPSGEQVQKLFFNYAKDLLIRNVSTSISYPRMERKPETDARLHRELQDNLVISGYLTRAAHRMSTAEGAEDYSKFLGRLLAYRQHENSEEILFAIRLGKQIDMNPAQAERVAGGTQALFDRYNFAVNAGFISDEKGLNRPVIFDLPDIFHFLPEPMRAPLRKLPAAQLVR